MFAPQNGDWFERIENSLNITYSPILKVGKKLSYDVQKNKIISPFISQKVIQNTYVSQY